jgi:hypothetical protein
MSKSTEFSRVSGRPFDEFNCFHIRDFEDGDCIRIRVKDGTLVRGIVRFTDVESNLIRYKTATDNECVATINEIVSLEEYRPNWLS